jgi:hypothetical protein
LPQPFARTTPEYGEVFGCELWISAYGAEIYNEQAFSLIEVIYTARLGSVETPFGQSFIFAFSAQL